MHTSIMRCYTLLTQIVKKLLQLNHVGIVRHYNLEVIVILQTLRASSVSTTSARHGWGTNGSGGSRLWLVSQKKSTITLNQIPHSSPRIVQQKLGGIHGEYARQSDGVCNLMPD